jgi:hypothetical protein
MDARDATLRPQEPVKAETRQITLNHSYPPKSDMFVNLDCLDEQATVRPVL